MAFQELLSFLIVFDYIANYTNPVFLNIMRIITEKGAVMLWGTVYKEPTRSLCRNGRIGTYRLHWIR